MGWIIQELYASEILFIDYDGLLLLLADDNSSNIWTALTIQSPTERAVSSDFEINYIFI